MTTIDFSIILDAESDYSTIVGLMSVFKRETGVDVNIKRMEWGDAWAQLIGIATQGHGADVSHVGSTWVSSLITMNALRPIPAHLVNKIGGEQTFVHSTWSSVIGEDDRHAYGIPLRRRLSRKFGNCPYNRRTVEQVKILCHGFALILKNP